MNYRNWPFSSFDAYQRQDRRSLIAKEVLLDTQIYKTIMDMHELELNKNNRDSIREGNGFL